MKTNRWLMLTIVLIGLATSYSAQDTILDTIIALYDDASAALAENDLASAQALSMSASNIITGDLIEGCPSLAGVQALLAQIEDSQDVTGATTLLNSVGNLLANCKSTSTSGNRQAASPQGVLPLGGSANPIGTPSAVVPSLQDALQLARTFDSDQNHDWQPFEYDFERVAMVLVPAGCFMMSDQSKPMPTPSTQICFESPFWIDKYEVSNAQFTTFGGEATNASQWTEAELPRDNITWSEADAFCRLRGARLPTEAEWEYAARGPESWLYPWGDTYNSDNVVWADPQKLLGTAPVGSIPSGASWVGALDMAGNVMEWTSSRYQSYPYDADDGRESDPNDLTRVARGGSWDLHEINFRADRRGWSENLDTAIPGSTGLRCALDSQ